MDDLSRVSGESSVESSVSVHDDEAELGVGLEKFGEGIGVEFVVAKVEGAVRDSD